MNESISKLPTQDAMTMDAMGADESTLSQYDSSPIASDQRQSYRYPAQPGRSAATVRVGRAKWKAQLCEESAGGLAIEVAGKFPLKIDDEVEIGIYSGWYRARVIHQQPTEGGQHVGLQRISIIAAEDEQPRRKGAAESSGQFRHLIPVALVAMALGIVTSEFIRGRLSGQDMFVQEATPIHFARQPNDQLQGVLDGATLLLEPEVAKQLDLSKTQQESIEGYLIGASNSLAQAHEESQGKSPDVWYRESQTIVNKAIENILCSMTDEQVLRWRAILQHRRESR